QPAPAGCRLALYGGLEELHDRFPAAVREADLVVLGSYVPDGVAVARWVQAIARGTTAFYDIDTPVTLAALARGDCAYLVPELVPGFDLYLSFTGGPTLGAIERDLGAPRARALYCSADPEVHRPDPREPRWDLGYVGTYSADRQPTLERLLVDPARRRRRMRFAVAGPQYPATVRWPANVERYEHLAPGEHAAFYASQRFTLNVTRADMVRAGWSPSVRLFEAAACGTPILSDPWPGLETIFAPQREILLARSTAEALAILEDTPEDVRGAIGERARRRVLAEHTAAHRVEALEAYVREVRAAGAARRRRATGARARP
ncbi:MAG TPA: glycosyltransferase, partial [Anaeromyxobacteraceae bacterium]|nr:glycosyltransferase [Anaeromyxobacteraceae bacterium]